MSYRMTTSASSRYAPLRYEATRPFALRLGTRFMLHARQGVKERLRFLQRDLLPDIRRELNQLGTQRGPGPGQAEISNTQVFGYYHGAGKIIFDFHKSLTSALLETDVESIPLSAIPAPADSVYLHFGAGTGLALEDDAIEGAFVTWTRYAGEEPRMIVDFVSAGQFADPYFWLREEGEPMTGCSIVLSDLSRGVIQALEASTAEIIERNREVLANLKETERQLAEQYGEVVSIPSPIKVKFIGHQFASSTQGLECGQTGRTLATHFRRGHFRNQPYGPERSMRKVIFIPPVIVNPGQGDAPGRIYEV